MRIKRKVSVGPFIALIVCMVGAFIYICSGVNGKIAETEDTFVQRRLTLSARQTEQSDLENVLLIVDTDAYIEREARTQHGFMKPDEIRFVISNPEVLYGEEGVPIRE